MESLIVAPSILSADFSRLGEEAQLMEKAGADWLHVDVMDGHFVPNITIGPVGVEGLKKNTRVPLDVHLMISDPLKYAEPFAKAGAWGMTFHIEAVKNPREVISEFKRLGVKPGMSLRPKTPAKEVLPFLEDLHLVLVMTVEPGFGGQSFMAGMIPKVEEIAAHIKDHNVPCLLEVDGGVNPQTGARVVKAGANALVAGNAIFHAPDPIDMVRTLKKLPR